MRAMASAGRRNGFGSISVSDPVWSFLTRFDIADTIRQIVGVGSVGMRVYLVLLVERRTGDPFFLQIKEAVPSVYARFLGRQSLR